MPRSDPARSQSARATTLTESRFRITAPNSLPRVVTIVSLDPRSDLLVATLTGLPWGNATFVGCGDDARERVGDADLVVLVATAGAAISAQVAASCRALGVTMMGVVVQDGGDAGATLGRLRPYCGMLVATTSGECVADLLAALRA